MKKYIFTRTEIKNALSSVMKNFGYEKVEMFQGRSIIFDCTFYKTEFENVYITDYDISNDCALNDKTFLIFNFKTGNRMRISFEAMDQSQQIIKNFLKEIV